jgi:hypothetical protein
MINFLLSSTYIIGVEACCIGNSCPKVTSFNAQFDSGTSFTFLPGHAYGAIAEEVLVSFEFMIVNLFSSYLYDDLFNYLLQFDKQVNATRSTFQGSPWEYCYVPR